MKEAFAKFKTVATNDTVWESEKVWWVVTQKTAKTIHLLNTDNGLKKVYSATEFNAKKFVFEKEFAVFRKKYTDFGLRSLLLNIKTKIEKSVFSSKNEDNSLNKIYSKAKTDDLLKLKGLAEYLDKFLT